MKNISVFYPNFFQFLEVKYSIYLSKRVFVMLRCSLAYTSTALEQTEGSFTEYATEIRGNGVSFSVCRNAHKKSKTSENSGYY